jgi:class 3 adenylate cyclase
MKNMELSHAHNESLSLETLHLFDIGEEAARVEAATWDEEAGMNLYLEDSILLVRRELETTAQLHHSTTQASQGTREYSLSLPSPSSSFSPPRLYVMLGSFSSALIEIEHYKQVARNAEVFLFGVPDALLPEIPNLRAVAIEAGTTLSRERSVIFEGDHFSAALFAVEAGQLEDDGGSRYFEGYLTARAIVVAEATQRLEAVLQLPPRGVHPQDEAADTELVTAWQSRLNARFLERLEGQKLALRAREREFDNLLDDRRRLSQMADMARGYLGERTWHELELAIERGRDTVADRREELTVCFCDLVGFTAMSERLHPTEIASFLNDHYARLHDIVRAHGGWVDKFIGDAMLAIFENPVEAMAAAQKMARESRSVRINNLREEPVRVRVGLSTGIVAVANLGVPERRERTVLGDVVNVAQRLQTAAEPRTVVISERTFARLPFSMSSTMERIEVEAKGKREVVGAYRWSVHSARHAPDESMVVRGTILSASRRAPLSERLQRGRDKDAR